MPHPNFLNFFCCYRQNFTNFRTKQIFDRHYGTSENKNSGKKDKKRRLVELGFFFKVLFRYKIICTGARV